jgi:dihydroflavonol-4-reductase
MFFDPAKAVRELGLPQTPVDQALRDAVDWFWSRGYARPRPGAAWSGPTAPVE